MFATERKIETPPMTTPTMPTIIAITRKFLFGIAEKMRSA
jgi:hypothetical protein